MVNVVVTGAVERTGPAVGADAGLLAGLTPIGLPVVEDLGEALSGASVVVDFTSHEASARHAAACAERGVAAVIGSTGFTAETKARVTEAARWKENGWKTANKLPVKNQNLWEALDEAIQRHEVNWLWVKGHNAHPENERCDELARTAICNNRDLRPAQEA